MDEPFDIHPLEVSEQGKMWAVLSYLGTMMGVPLALIPLIQREDEFALLHARHALANYLAVLVIGGVYVVVTMPLALCTFGLSTFVTLPLVFLLAAWPLVVIVHGLVLSVNGERTEPIGGFGLGEMLFGRVTVKPEFLD